jgi:PhnB protein
MGVSPYINFNGDCREAVGFYAKVFRSPEPEVMEFGDAPPSPEFSLPESAKHLIMHAEFLVDGTTIMCSDVPPGMSVTKGDNISLIVRATDEAKVRSWFSALSEGGKIEMPLAPQFWSPLYGSLVDRFGIGWQLYLASSAGSETK